MANFSAQPKPTASNATLAILRPTSWQLRLVRVLLLWAGVVALCSFLDSAAFDNLESDARGLRTSVRGAQRDSSIEWAREHVVILALSDESFAASNDQRLPVAGPPVPRNFHAKLIRDLTRAGAKVIAFDFLFMASRPPDAEFALAAKESGRVVWACRQDDNLNESGAARKLILPVPALLAANPVLGHINAPKEGEHAAVTRIPAAVEDRGKTVPAFSIAAAQVFLGIGNVPLQRTAQGWQAPGLAVPVDANGCFPIKYLGTKSGEVFSSLPYETIYHGWLDSDFYKAHADDPNVSLRGKIVLVGDTTTLGHDVAMTPIKEMPGVEVHAHAIATLLQGRFLKFSSDALNLAVLAALTALACLSAALWRSQWALLTTVLLLVGLVVANVWLFVELGWELRLVAPSVGMILATVLVVAERNLTVERARHQATALLQRYVSPQIANYILAHPEKASLGGSRVTATVLFSDIRGFTAMSEKLTPEEVLTRLNEYLQAMTDVVFKNDGAVDKYIGDAVMALFGVPLYREDHAQQAMRTAIEMQDALLVLQEKWRGEGLPLIDIGIGINTGEMIFGNMGANERMDFSVLGDTVNLASRVESLNKDMKSRILITESTFQIVGDTVRTRGPLTTHVKGKEETVVVYEVFGWKE